MIVFITTCSAKKIAGGKHYGAYGWHSEKRSILLRKRRRALQMMKTGMFKSDLDHPVEGPDFGGDAESGLYSPALKRYQEGAFVRGLIASKAKLSEWGKRNRLYFISGLYGLAHYNEPIQNYDLPLEQGNLSDYWREEKVLTQILLQDISQPGKKCWVIDCCVNENYRALIDWSEVRNAGHEVRHAVANGSFERSQIRWACGHVAGGPPERLQDLIDYEELQYTSDNGSLCLLKEIQSPQPASQLQKPVQSIPIPVQRYPTVALAVHRASQVESFMSHARKQGWDKTIRFETIYDLRKETIARLNKHGTKLLIVHIDDTHAGLQKAYKSSSFDIVKDLPEDWQHRKVKKEKYSDIQFGAKLTFKI